MGCLKLTYDQELEPSPFLTIWKKGGQAKTNPSFFVEPTEKNTAKKIFENYYPFGLTFNSYQSGTGNKYLYNQGSKTTSQGTQGKEFKTERQHELGLDMTKFRMYDYALGRFISIDPLSDHPSQIGISPYHYGLNNPILFNDPLGDCPECLADDQVIRFMVLQAGAAVMNFASGFKGMAIAVANNSRTVTSTETTVVVNEAGYPSLQTQEVKENGATAAVNTAVDGLASVPGTNPTGLLAKTGSKATVVNTVKTATKAPAGRAGKTIAKENGVTVQSYGTNDVHKPAHAHVKGGGKEVRIGANGKPLEGQPELSTRQKSVVDNNIKPIRKEINKVGKANKAIEDYNKANQ